MLSNIAAGSSRQLTELLVTPSLVPSVLTQLASSAEWDVRKEAAWVVSNAISGGSPLQVMTLVGAGLLRPLCDLLEVSEVRMLLLAMDAIEVLIKKSKDTSTALATASLISAIEECEGVDRLEKLQEHESTQVYSKAVALLENYFGGEEEVDSENLAPLGTATGFVFGNINSSAVSKTFKAGFDFSSVPSTGLRANGMH